MSKFANLPNQTGILIPGPGAIRINALINQLPSLTLEQQESVNKAKKYAFDVSIKSLQVKPSGSESQHYQRRLLQRHQALVLMCRVYVGSISFEITEEILKNSFSPYGAIKSLNMSRDPVTLKHKGFVFVEYELPEAAQLAIDHMNGVQLGSRQLKVGRPSNMPQAAPFIDEIQNECKSKNRVYISNVLTDFDETDLVEMLDAFGDIRNCKLFMAPNSDVPTHRGYGFVEFETEDAAVEALTLNNIEYLKGQLIYVCAATTPEEHITPHGTLNSAMTTASKSISI